MKIKLAFAAITLAALGVVGCTPTNPTTAGYPHCQTAPSTVTCIQIVQDDNGTGSGWLVHTDGTVTPINFWSDGTVELY